MMQLFNSLTKKVEQFKPLKPGTVGLYTCGPTVYDHVHIGNLRTYIFEDTLRRTLKLSGYRVKHVMNFTDVDDKTIARSRQAYPKASPKAALKKLTRHYEGLFLDDVRQVGVDLGSSKLVRASESIAAMQKLIRQIPPKYVAKDGVYFDIKRYSGYGVFENLNRQHQHHRINNDEYDKDHVADFALWKSSQPSEPSWDFKLEGTSILGRPGWHIECSAMSTAHLGQPFDIHTGGVDLKFPHHENEIAQSKSVNGLALANYFLHAEHLLVDGKKMSKRLKNFYTLADISRHGHRPLAFRLLLLQSHYRSQLNFTWESLAGAENFLQSIYAAADRQFQATSTKTNVDIAGWLGQGKSKILNWLQDDLNTPKAIAWLAQLVDFIETTPINKKQLPLFRDFLKFLDEIFGLRLAMRRDITLNQKKLIKQRQNARAKKDFAAADKIRAELGKQGIALNDTPFGATWSRT